MNPFSAFLQPPTQRSPLAGAGEFVQGLQQLALQKRGQEFREKESGLDNARADSYLKLQQGQQARTFSDADKKEVESLLAEYQDAEDQGDPVRLSRAAQMLKRFGMDVSQGGMDPRAAAFTGAPPLPGMLPSVPQGVTIAGEGGAQDFTGTSPDGVNPIGDAITAEQESRAALQERNEVTPPDRDAEVEALLRQKVAPGQKRQAPPLSSTGLPTVTPGDPADITDPGTKSAGSVEADFSADEPAETSSQAPQAAAAFSPGLGGGLPVRITKGGKTLYESTGPSGRWAPMVQSVFQAASQHQDPEFAAAGKRAQEMATKLIGVDGIAPKDAIKFAASQLENEIQNITNLRRTELGTRPKYAGGGGSASGVNAKARLPLSKEMLASARFYKSENIQQGLQGYESALSSLNSENPASQNDSINQLIAARSGKTVSDRERALYDRMSGVWEQAKKTFNMAAGEQMPALYRKQLRQLMTEARDALVEEREKRALAAQQFHTTRMRGAMTPEEIAADAAGVADAVRFGDGGGGPPEMPSPQDPNADLYQ